MSFRPWHWIQGIANLNGLRRLLKKIPKPLHAAINVGIFVVDKLKTALDEAGDIVTLLIPGNLDDELVAKLKAGLPKIALDLRLVDATLGLTDPNEILLAAMKALQQISGDVKSDFLDAFAVQVTLLAGDGSFSWNDAKSMVKWVYDYEHKTPSDTQ